MIVPNVLFSSIAMDVCNREHSAAIVLTNSAAQNHCVRHV